MSQLSWENTIPSIPPRHHRNTAKTPKTSPDTVKTLRTHHQSATKTPTTTETKLTSHQDTSTTDTTSSRKDLQRVFSQKVVADILCHDKFSHHHLVASLSTQHRHNNIITAPPPSPSSSTTTITTSSLFVFGKFQLVHLKNEIHRCTCRYVNINISY